MADKRTMTLNLTEDEMNALTELSARYDMTKTSVMRKAFRVYLAIDSRLQNGEKLFVEDEIEKKKSEIVLV